MNDVTLNTSYIKHMVIFTLCYFLFLNVAAQSVTSLRPELVNFTVVESVTISERENSSTTDEDVPSRSDSSALECS